ncbi:ZYRO0C10692p [Zygosaccharomyces rouxii]|uniref:DNA-binding protein RAP1 n=1 Tax=Zygosaccharomyces rouxii (strain ATCC 2623 / CBS 732 / NBRC 1130 / NCYC 568 / NRRL Y-229) TaxID=559307 RepID=C5DTR6_ZYGRC|nr:uncharacterized protein ZYRO0C10692g [Zygosaccharomyces rouxii]KAH9201647.1 hypothetical protein LQ764DRAFT_176333 [Zygosaccharomyces rouxii]CAR27177.1 ZYRO0C10692p [Zygosaccharomyces rouxii]
MSSPTEFSAATDQFVDPLGSNIIETTTKAAAAAAAAGNNTAADQNVNDDSNEDRNEDNGEENEHPQQGLIFQGMSFYVNRDSSANDSANDIDRLHQLVESRGGTVLHEMPIKELIGPGVFIVSPYNDTRLPTVNPTYIRACCQNGTLLDIGNYLVPFDEYRSVIDTELQDEQNRHQEQQQEQRNQEDESRNQQKPDQTQIIGGSVNTKPHYQAEGPQNLPNEDQMEKQNHGEEIQEDPEEEQQQPLAEVEQKVRTNEGSPNDVSLENGYDSSSRSMLARSNLATHNKASFTEQEDEFILDVVRKNPTRRTTHTLYDEISHYVPNHTGNSIRHRFRVYLSKRLEYVYEVDKDGKLIRDANGNLVHTKVLPPSIKKKFTAEEDYQLAIGIKKQFYRDLYQIDPDTGVSLISDEDSPTAIAKRNMTMDPNHVPGTEPNFQDYRVSDRRGPIAREFFKHFGESHPTHTENAWRDRFRKFLLSYGIDNYIYYYERELGHGNDPEPMKNLTNRVKRPGIPTPGNYNSAKKARYSSTDSRSAASSPSSNGDGNGGNNSATVAAAAAAAAAMAAAQNNNVDANNAAAAAAAAAGASVPANHYAIPENEFLDEDTINFLTNLRTDLNKDESNVPFEYPQEIAEAIRNDFSNEEANFDNIDPDYIPFPPQIASIDLFLPQFFNMRSTREFMEKIHEVISREYEPSQAEKLVQDLCDEAGVRKTFSTSILTALSGDLMVFPRYFLNMFRYNVNPPPSVPGIWTREDDRMLISNKDEDIRILTKKHGAGRIEMRRKFVEKELI